MNDTFMTAVLIIFLVGFFQSDIIHNVVLRHSGDFFTCGGKSCYPVNHIMRGKNGYRFMFCSLFISLWHCLDKLFIH